MSGRIVSLIPSSTEIVCALGAEDNLVGRSHECDYPPSVKSLPICTEPKFNPEGTSYEIDQRVKTILQDGLSVYRVDANLLKKLQPNIIITQAHCEVCAVSLNDVKQAVCEWMGSRPHIVCLEPNALSDIWEDIMRVADALESHNQGCELVEALKERIKEIHSRVSGILKKPTVACIEWIDPLMAAGNWIPTLVELAGGINLFGEAGHHSPWMTWEELVRKNPDIILAMPCGFDIQRTEQEMVTLIQKREWGPLKAVQNGDVYLLDGNQYFNRPGPRVVESLEILTEILHPHQFQSRHVNKGWKKRATD